MPLQAHLDRSAAVAQVSPPVAEKARPRWGMLRTIWGWVSAAIGAAMGLLPHVLHHVGIFAGALLVTGVTGNLVFGVVGLVLSIPLLLRLRRRFGTWKAPAIALALFTVTFSLSAFVIGPAVAGGDSAAEPAAPSSEMAPGEHAAHHR